MRCLVYTLNDGSVRIGRICREDGSLAAGEDPVFAGMDDNAIIEAIAVAALPAGASWRLADSAELPSGQESGSYDKTFSEAFVDNAGSVIIDMPKARELHRRHMREASAPLLKALSDEYQIADEGTNDNGAPGSAARLVKKAIAAQKQALRDVTADPAIDAAQTPEELKAVWPEILSGD